MKKLRVGFIGSGFIAQFHAKAMLQIREMELTAILKRDNSTALSGWAQENGLGEAREYETIAELAKQVDAIAMYCPNDARIEVMEQIVAAKKAGAPLIGVICDKPLGRTVAEARKIAELAKEAGLKSAYFENQIYMKVIQSQRSQLRPQQETMGPLTLTRSAEEHAGPHMPWFWDPTQQGGGVLSDMGCHSIAVGWYCLTPWGKSPLFLRPESVSCEIALLKWGQPKWRDELLKRTGVDYHKTPAEDFATGLVTFRNPETGQRVKAQFTDSWMFEKQGLRLFMDGMGPGYAFEVNTLVSSLTVFVGDEAAEAVADSETALEKSTASRGLLAVQPNEADLYGYVDENRDAAKSFLAGHDAMLSFEYGLEITRLVMASYLSAERGKRVDLTDPETQRELETFVPLVAQGRGNEVLRREHL